MDRILESASADVIWLAPYREAHFLDGSRIALPRSWRRFLMVLHQRRCSDCNNDVGVLPELDHMRPLRPDHSPFHPILAGNSVLFNLALLCRDCNRAKATRFVFAPERDVSTLIWDARVRAYFRTSLRKAPSLVEHALPQLSPPLGEA